LFQDIETLYPQNYPQTLAARWFLLGPIGHGLGLENFGQDVGGHLLSTSGSFRPCPLTGRKTEAAMNQLYTLKEVGVILKRSRAGLYLMIGRGELAAVKHGKHTVIRQSELDRYLATLQPATVQAVAPMRGRGCERPVASRG
jgi:excisionase family DNA binding protein